MNMTISSLYSEGLHSQKISIQKNTFGEKEDSHHGCVTDKYDTCVMLSCQYGPKSLRNVSAPCWIYPTKYYGSSEGRSDLSVYEYYVNFKKGYIEWISEQRWINLFVQVKSDADVRLH